MAISIQDFQAAMGTKYNLGNVQLGEGPDARLTVVNNHHLLSNGVPSDPAANRRVREALVRALTDGGRCSERYCAALRERLLGGTHAEEDLTRAEIKTLLDKTANHVRQMEQLKAIVEVPPDEEEPPDTTGFDELLKMASTRATAVFNGRGVRDILPEGLSLELRSELEGAALHAENALKRIYALTGAELAAPTDATKDLVAVAIEQLQILADGFTHLFNVNATPENGDLLAELAAYCNARAAELNKVFVSAQLYGSEDMSEAAVAFRAKNARELVGDAALEMHGTADFIRIVESHVKPLLADIAALKRGDGAIPLTPDTIRDLQTRLLHAQQTVKLAHTHGIALEKDSDSVFKADASLTKHLVDILTTAAKDVDELAAAHGRKEANDLLATIFSTAVVDANTKLTPEEKTEAKRYVNEFISMINKAFKAEPPDVLVFDRIARKIERNHISYSGLISCSAQGVLNVKKIVRALLQADGTVTPVSKADMMRCLKGELGVGTLVGARTYGFDASLVDPSIDDRFVVDEKVLGAGNVNQVTRLTYRKDDGTTVVRVFKPEVTAMEGMRLLALGTIGYANTLQTALINHATYKAAEALGCPQVAVKITVGMHKGQFGFFMEEAPGATGYETTIGTVKDARKAGLLEPATFGSLTREQQLGVLGPVLRDFMSLSWLDWLTGQMDRHGDNFKAMVGPRGQTSVKGIDNDGAFPDYRLGAYKFVLRTDYSVRRFCHYLGVANREALLSDPDYKGLVREENGMIILDAETDPDLLHALRYAFGLNSAYKPTIIPKPIYDKLMALDAEVQKSGDAALNAFVEGLLGPQFTAGQKEATVSRLKEMIAEAKKIASCDKARIPTDDDWKRPTYVSAIVRTLIGENDNFTRSVPHGLDEDVRENMIYLHQGFWIRDYLSKRPLFYNLHPKAPKAPAVPNP